jgi:hypothetical protein
MPQRPEFDMNSETVAPVYGRVGVLESDTSKVAVLGAYYDRSPEFSGLYVISTDGIKYFDIQAGDLYPVGLTGYVEFNSEEVSYLIRELDEEDGLWMSVYKTELPIPVLQQMIVTKSKNVIQQLTKIALPDTLPDFESLYIYYESDSDRLSTIIYMSSYGIFSRSEADWQDIDLNLPELQDLVTEDVSPANANALINLYDDNLGIVSLQEAKKYTIKVSK